MPLKAQQSAAAKLDRNLGAFYPSALGFECSATARKPSLKPTLKRSRLQMAESALTQVLKRCGVLLLLNCLLILSVLAQAEPAQTQAATVKPLKAPAEIGVTQNAKPQAPISVIEAKAQAAATDREQSAEDLSADELVSLNQAGIRVPGVTDNPAISWGRGGDLVPNTQRANSPDTGAPRTDAQADAAAPPQSAQVIPSDSLTLATPIIDPTGFLDPAKKQALDQRIRELFAADLVQIGVVVVPSTGELDIFDYGLPIATRWQLGSAAKDNGLLILLVYADRKVFVFTGYGVEGALPDAALARIIREDMKPAFSQNQYAQGISNGIDAMVTRLQTDPALLRQADQQIEQNASLRQLALVLGLIALGAGSFIATKLGRIGGGALASLAYGGLGLAAGLSATQLILGAIAVFAVTLIGVLQLLALFSQGAAAGGMGRGGFGGRGGSFGGGGGFSGGGGGFGGGGAGGSW